MRSTINPELQLKNSKPFCFHNEKLLVHKNTNHRTPQQGTLFGLKERFQEISDGVLLLALPLCFMVVCVAAVQLIEHFSHSHMQSAH